MKKTMLPALSALGLLAACSGGAESPKDEVAAEASAPAAEAAPAGAPADDDNDSAAPTPAKAGEDHPHDGSEGAEHKH